MSGNLKGLILGVGRFGSNLLTPVQQTFTADPTEQSASHTFT
jgi:hypothetical protein